MDPVTWWSMDCGSVLCIHLTDLCSLWKTREKFSTDDSLQISAQIQLDEFY